MPLSRFPGLAALSPSLLLLASCSFEPQYNRYQSAGVEGQVGQAAVVELQRNALDALARQAYQQAIDLLQRAIRIEPRDPVNWHYLAQTYRRSGDLKRCLEMVERSFSYSASNDELERANRLLRESCRQL